MNGFDPGLAVLAATAVIVFAAVGWLISTRRDRKRVQQ